MKKSATDAPRPGERIEPTIPDDLPEGSIERTVAILRLLAGRDTQATPLERMGVDSAIDSGVLIVAALMGVPATLERIATALETIAGFRYLKSGEVGYFGPPSYAPAEQEPAEE